MEQMERLRRASDLLDDLLEVDRKDLRRLLGLVGDEEYHCVAVDYSRTEELWCLAGTSINPSHFLMSGSGSGVVVFETKLFDTAADVVNPWQPAGIEHGLVWAATCPNEDRHFNVVMPGACCEIVVGEHVVARLFAIRFGEDGTWQARNLDYWASDAVTDYRYLGVRRVR